MKLNRIVFQFWILFTVMISSASFGIDDRPNIIVLLTDDQAKTTVGCYGNRQAKTPNLDRLAQRGVLFDRHYVTTAICMASRATIFTGLYEYRHGCNFTYRRLTEQHWQNSYPLLLRKAGYRTAMAGKIGLEIENRKKLPAADFDMWGAGPGQTSFVTEKNPSIVKYAEEFPHASRAYGAFGRDFIRDSVAAKKKFCLSISFKAPHRPVQPDPEFDHVYKETRFIKPENFGRDSGRHLAEQSRRGRQYPRFESWGYASNYDAVMRKYHQQVYGVDVAIGMILDELDQQNIRDETVVIFTSDNGFLCGAHGYGSKVLPYEESTSVPLIVSDPRQPKTHGQRCDSLTGSVDLCPTILALAGVSNQRLNLDGVSILPLLERPEAEVREELQIMNYWGPAETHSFGLVTRDWKFIYWYSQADQMFATEELFDMSGPRNELENLSESRESALNRMRDRYDRSVYGLKEKSIDAKYGKYYQLFDRKTPWDTKRELLNSQFRK